MSRLTHLSTTFALVVAAATLTASPALARDRDHDQMLDKWEKRHHLNLKKDDSRRDRDRDGLSNYGEYRAHTNPRKKDSDHDGRRDSREDFDRDHLRNAAEIHTGFDPRDKDSDNDGTKDGRENAGKIVKLSDSSLTIRLAVGGKLTAGLGDVVVQCAPSSGSGTGSAPDEDTPEPGEDAPEPGEDDDPGDLPALPDDGDGDTGDAPDDPIAAAAQDPGEDADEFNDDEFDQSFNEDDAGSDCGTTTLKVGAMVHKAKVSRTASGKVFVSVALLGTRK